MMTAIKIYRKLKAQREAGKNIPQDEIDMWKRDAEAEGEIDLISLAEYWCNVKSGDNYFPDGVKMSLQTARNIGENILDLYKRLETSEARITSLENKQSKS